MSSSVFVSASQDIGDAMIFAGIASIPSRALALEQAVLSLLPQVDKVGVVLNGYDHVPHFLTSKHKVEVVRAQSVGDYRDLAKFYFYPAVSGIYFSCDDDLFYPDDYVSRSRRALEAFGTEVIVSWHGYTLDPLSPRMETRRLYHCLRKVKSPLRVHVGGTGAMAQWTKTCLPLTLSTAEKDDVADLWVARIAKTRGVPIHLVPHEAGELKYLLPDDAPTLWQTSENEGHVRYNELLKRCV